jgi:23S rRNA pseudouridine2605 synthase
MRLAKYLAHAGVASRRAAETIITDGRVSVNGLTVTDPARDVEADLHEVSVDGRPVGPATTRVVYALHKPAGVVSTARDTHGRPTVVELVPGDRRLYPVGRLDADTTGLILLTDDGDLAHRLTHPSFEVDKTYLATVAHPPVTEAALEALRVGVQLEDGPTAPARVERVGRGGDRLAITIHEGRKRQVKRMCDTVGHPVTRLQRVRFGPLELGALPPGRFRRLSAEEVAALARAGRVSTRPGDAGPPARGNGRRPAQRAPQ